MRGVVKFFNSARGFGFVKADNGEEYFCHIKAVADGRELAQGEEVIFDLEPNPRGPRAVNVVVVNGR